MPTTTNLFKPVTVVVALVIAIALVAAACGSDDAVTDDGASGPEPTTVEGQLASAEGDERIETLWVGPQLVDCVGVAPQKCLQVRRAADGQVEWFYDSIEGFEHVAGTTYELKVGVTDVENPPADASSLRYRLIEVVSSSSESAVAALDGTTWILRGFRNGDLFDSVSDDVEISISFDTGQVNGSAGCNSYMGTYTADGDSITFGPLASTRMMCPPEVMRFEDRFLPLIGTVESAEVTFDGALLLVSPTGDTLVFGPTF